MTLQLGSAFYYLKQLFIGHIKIKGLQLMLAQVPIVKDYWG